jgi:hypothetical protein
MTEQIRDRLKADGRVTGEREVRRLRPLSYTRAELHESKRQPPEAGVVFQRADHPPQPVDLVFLVHRLRRSP